MHLTANLISFWELEEASGTRLDAVTATGNDLTDENTVTQQAGKVGNCAQFTLANSESLSHADNSSLSVGNIDFTFCAWVYLDSKPATSMVILSQWDAPGRSYLLYWDPGTDRFVFSASSDGSATDGSVSADSLGAPSLATWYFIVIWHDATADTINIQVNDGTVDSFSYPYGFNDSSIDFRLGAFGSIADGFLNGRMDQVGFWKRVLDSGERSQLYNGNDGLSYAQIVGGGLIPILMNQYRQRRG